MSARAGSSDASGTPPRARSHEDGRTRTARARARRFDAARGIGREGSSSVPFGSVCDVVPGLSLSPFVVEPRLLRPSPARQGPRTENGTITVRGPSGGSQRAAGAESTRRCVTGSGRCRDDGFRTGPTAPDAPRTGRDGYPFGSVSRAPVSYGSVCCGSVCCGSVCCGSVCCGSVCCESVCAASVVEVDPSCRIVQRRAPVSRSH